MQWGMALRMYAEEHDRQFPWSGGEDNASCLIPFHQDYLPALETFVCPSDAESRYEDFFEGTGRSGKGAPRPINSYLEVEASLRASYDYLGAYTNAPLRLPHPSQGVPRVPLAWDIASEGGYVVPAPGQVRRPGEPPHEPVRRVASAVAANHIPGGSNILWMDGSVTFQRYQDWPRANLPVLLPGIAMFDPDLGGKRPARLPHDPPPRVREEPVARKPLPKAELNTAALEALAKQSAARRAERPVAERLSAAGRAWRWFKLNVLYIR
jgi:prepilin-type processing-associated H-X9-DG protein